MKANGKNVYLNYIVSFTVLFTKCITFLWNLKTLWVCISCPYERQQFLEKICQALHTRDENIAQLSCEIRKQTNVGNLQATIGRFSLTLWIFEKCTNIWWIFECQTYSGLQLWAYFCKAHWANYATATHLLDNISELQAKSLPFSFDKMKTLSFRYIEPREKLDNFWRPMLLIIHRIQSGWSGLAWAF